jgi:signal transduction histidine kinase
MNIYSSKSKWKLFLLVCAIVTGIGSLLYTNTLVGQLKAEERKKIEIWTEVYRLFNDAESGIVVSGLDFYLHVMESNTTIPVIIADRNDQPKFWKNIDSAKVANPVYVARRLKQMKDKYEPVILKVHDGYEQYVYHDDSSILYQLTWYPYVQLGIISLFIGVAYFAFSVSRKSEQNQVWAGLSKETAHQLGTPVSSLLAIIEIIRMQVHNPALIAELEKDVTRLQSITDRFSKIGSKPATPPTNICEAIAVSLNYIRKRSPDRVTIDYRQPDHAILVPLSESLFGWVIENLCKNAVDAMGGDGTICVTLKTTPQQVIIDISDTGKGIPKRKFKTVFKPGYTTRARGWGLGLSLTKRIIEDYHSGQIFVAHSDPDAGTTFRIILKTGSS